MHKPIYIQAARAICAQDTFTNNNIPGDILVTNSNLLQYKEPDYSAYFSIMQLRRMSRIIRIGMVAAIECLKDAGIQQPQAIVTGTGRGSMSDTEKFLHNIEEFEEGTLNPTPFIQSTYNALNGLIALHHKAHGYNTTYVHRGFSLENAFADAIMLLNEQRIENALVGSFDEMTPEHFIIKNKMGYYKTEPQPNDTLLQSATKGSIAGEGCFFFALNTSHTGAMAQLCGLKMLYNPGEKTITNTLNLLLKENELSLSDIDAVILGYNGDVETRHYYDEITGLLQSHTHQLAFKHLCGEFDTAAGFAVWAAAHILNSQQIPATMVRKAGQQKEIKNVLVYNHYHSLHHAFYLLKAVEK